MTSSLVNLAPEIDAGAENFKVENQDEGEDVLENATNVSAGDPKVMKILLKVLIISLN